MAVRGQGRVQDGQGVCMCVFVSGASCVCASPAVCNTLLANYAQELECTLCHGAEQ